MKLSRTGCVVIFLLLAGGLHAQQPTRIVELPDVHGATADRAGDFYVVTGDAIHKYDTNGVELHRVNAPSQTTLFDTGNGVRLLAYFRDARKYIIYPPSLTPRDAVEIDPAFAIDPWLMCSSGDYDIIILDAADWSVKAIDTRRAVVDYEFALDLADASKPEITFMREYQGFLFLLDARTGISIYNRLGMKVRDLPVEGLRSFNFLGQELYYYQNGSIHFTDLFTLDTRTVKFDGPYKDVVIGHGNCLALTDDGLAFFSFVPGKTSETDR